MAKNPIEPYTSPITKTFKSVVGRAKPGKRDHAPSRADEGEKFLAALKNQAILLFGGIMPMGPAAVMKFLSMQSEIVKVSLPDGGSAPVLDLLLRLSEGVGLNSGYARIMRGASVTFATNGFEKARIEEILKAGDVSPRTFYQFFRNKHEVLASISDLFLTVILEMARREAGREGPADQRLHRFVQILLGGMAVIERMAQVVVSEALRPGSAMEPLADRFRAEMAEILLPTFRELHPDREPPDIKYVRIKIVAVMGALIELRLNSHSTADDLKKAEEIVFGILMA